MALNSSTVIHSSTPVIETDSPADYSPLLLLPVAAAVAFHYSKKHLRKAKRKMAWQVMKMNLKSLFSFKKEKGKGFGLKLLLILLGVGLIVGVGISLGWGTAIAFLLLMGLGALVFAGKN